MSDAATLAADRRTGRPTTWNSIAAVFSMTLGRQLGSKRVLLLAVLYALPIALAVLMRYVGAGFRGPNDYEPAFAEYTLIFNLIPQAFVPLTALVFASGMIQDEVEDQTITYLLIRPLPRWSIYAAKLLATALATIALTAAFTALVFLVIGWGRADYWGEPGGGFARMGKTIALFALSLTAYCSLFGLLGMLMRRSVLLGIVYIIALEGFVANIDFVIRKATVVYYFRVLCERWIELGRPQDFAIDLSLAPGLRECVLTLLGASAIMTALACLMMTTREFRVKTPEGS
jgi:ABC-2 type transport system permease protein